MKLLHIISLILILSFLTNPPSLASKSKSYQIDRSDPAVDSVVFVTLVGKVDAALADDPAKAHEMAYSLLEMSHEFPDNPWFKAKAKERIGVSLYYLDSIEESNKFYFEALLLFDSLGDIRNEALTLNNIAWNFRIQQKIDQAIAYFNNSLELFEQLEDWEHVQGVLNNLGTAYRRQEGMEREAIATFKKSLQINQRSGNKTWMAYNLNNIGLIHLDLQQYDSAIQFFKEAQQINTITQHQEERCRNLLNIAIAYLEMDQIDSSELYFDRSRAILDNHDFPKTEYVYNDYQYELQVKKSNYKAALDFLIQKTGYERRQLEQDSENRIAAMQAKYEQAKNNQEIELNQHRIQMRKSFVIIILLGSIVVLLAFIYYKKSAWAASNKKLNNELQMTILKLKDLNEENEQIKTNLKKLVREEAELILRKNAKLQKYAFINSHKIRGPLARILGLIHVINLEGHDIKNNTAFIKLNEASNELDQEIKEINQVLLEDAIEKHKKNI